MDHSNLTALDPQPINRSRLLHIGEYIKTNADRIVDDWAAASRAEHPEARAEQHQALRDQLPAFLRDYGAGMMDGGDEAISSRHAIEHGVQRWEIG